MISNVTLPRRREQRPSCSSGVWKARAVADVEGAVAPVLGGLIRELDRAAPMDLVGVCRTGAVENLGVEECALLLADCGKTTLELVRGAERPVKRLRL